MTLHVGHEPALTPPEDPAFAFECVGCKAEGAEGEFYPLAGSLYCQDCAPGASLDFSYGQRHVLLESEFAEVIRIESDRLEMLRRMAADETARGTNKRIREMRERVARETREKLNGRSPSLSPAASAIAAACATAAGQPSCVYCPGCGHLHASGPCPCACKPKIAAGVSR